MRAYVCDLEAIILTVCVGGWEVGGYEWMDVGAWICIGREYLIQTGRETKTGLIYSYTTAQYFKLELISLIYTDS